MSGSIVTQKSTNSIEWGKLQFSILLMFAVTLNWTPAWKHVSFFFRAVLSDREIFVEWSM